MITLFVYYLLKIASTGFILDILLIGRILAIKTMIVTINNKNKKVLIVNTNGSKIKGLELKRQ